MVNSSKIIKFTLQEIPEGDIEWVQLIRTGKFNHQFYGKFDITEDVLKSFKLNFDRNARGVDLAVDYFHESYAEAAGWIQEIELRDNDKSLWIKVDWTETARKKILDKEIRYISADFDLDYEDSETGVEYGAALYGAGLTNRPHVKGMQPIFSEECVEQQLKKLNEGNTMAVSFEDMLKAVSGLSEDEKLQLGEKLGFSVKASDVQAKLDDAEKAKKLAEDKISEKDSDVQKLQEDFSNLKAQLAEKDKEIEFNKLLSNGSAVEAQRSAYMKGDMTEFAKNAVTINLSEIGSNSVESASKDDAEIKLNEKAEQIAKDKGVAFTEAYKEAVKANPDLAKKLSD